MVVTTSLRAAAMAPRQKSPLEAAPIAAPAATDVPRNRRRVTAPSVGAAPAGEIARLPFVRIVVIEASQLCGRIAEIRPSRLAPPSSGRREGRAQGALEGAHARHDVVL